MSCQPGRHGAKSLLPDGRRLIARPSGRSLRAGVSPLPREGVNQWDINQASSTLPLRWG